MTHSHDTSTPAMSAETVPSEEFVPVPREPTHEMKEAGARENQGMYPIAIYRAMIDAAPVLNPSPAAKGGDAVREALLDLNKRIKSLPRRSFVLTPEGNGVRAVRDSSGAWLNFHEVTDLFSDEEEFAALSTPTEGPASQTEGMGGEVKAKAKQALYSLRFEGQPMSSMFSAEELGLIVDTVSAALSTPTEGPASQTEGMGGDATKLRENIEAFLEMHRRGVLTPRTPNIPIELLQKALAALTQPETAEAVPPLYLIRKGGAFYRPNSQGYTRSIAEAGRYSLAEAEAITHPNGPNGPRDGMDYIPAPALASDPAPATDDRERLVEAEAVFRKIREYAENIAFSAGVGESEIAGQIVSFLVDRPELLRDFMAGTLSAIDTGMLDHHNGVLSYWGMDGKVHRPDPRKARFPARRAALATEASR